MIYRRLIVAAVAMSLFVLPISAQQRNLRSDAVKSKPMASPTAVSTDIVIIQVYGGGGNSGAT